MHTLHRGKIWKMRKFFPTFLLRYVKEIYRRMCTILLVKAVYAGTTGQRTCIPMVDNRRLRATVKIPEKMVRMDSLFPGIQTLGGQIRNFCWQYLCTHIRTLVFIVYWSRDSVFCVLSIPYLELVVYSYISTGTAMYTCCLYRIC